MKVNCFLDGGVKVEFFLDGLVKVKLFLRWKGESKVVFFRRKSESKPVFLRQVLFSYSSDWVLLLDIWKWS